MCVSEREKERERERARESKRERERKVRVWGYGFRVAVPNPYPPNQTLRGGASACATVLPPSGFGLWVFVVSGACRGTRVWGL